MIRLVPCPACQRHVRCTELACPFCSAGTAAAPVANLPSVRGLRRAALFALGASLSAAACGGDDEGTASEAVMQTDDSELGGAEDEASEGDGDETPADGVDPVDAEDEARPDTDDGSTGGDDGESSGIPTGGSSSSGMPDPNVAAPGRGEPPTGMTPVSPSVQPLPPSVAPPSSPTPSVDEPDGVSSEGDDGSANMTDAGAPLAGDAGGAEGGVNSPPDPEETDAGAGEADAGGGGDTPPIDIGGDIPLPQPVYGAVPAPPRSN